MGEKPKSFSELYEKHADGIAIESLKLKIEGFNAALTECIGKMDITFPVNADWVGAQTRIMDAEGRFITFVSAGATNKSNVRAICELLNFAAAEIGKSGSAAAIGSTSVKGGE